MSLKNRVKRAAAKIEGDFACSDFEHAEIQIFHKGDPAMQSAEAGRCPECGRQKRLIIIEIV